MKKLTLSLLALAVFAGSSLQARANSNAVEPKAKMAKSTKSCCGCGSKRKAKSCCKKKSSCGTCNFNRCDGRGSCSTCN